MSSKIKLTYEEQYAPHGCWYCDRQEPGWKIDVSTQIGGIALGVVSYACQKCFAFYCSQSGVQKLRRTLLDMLDRTFPNTQPTLDDLATIKVPAIKKITLKEDLNGSFLL